MENNISIKKDVIYATALLHDIGRSVEYIEGTSHHEAGAKLALPILEESGFSKQECQEICEAILKHKHSSKKAKQLSSILYESDKQSRNCFDCPVKEECYWPEEKKNAGILL